MSTLLELRSLPFLLFPIACSLTAVYSGRLSECSGVAKRQRSWGEVCRPLINRSWTCIYQPMEEEGFSLFCKIWWDCRDHKKKTQGRGGGRIAGKTGTKTRTHSLLNNLYRNTEGYRGKGVGLGLLCAREEERVPGDVILTGRGQLSQYNRFQKN